VDDSNAHERIVGKESHKSRRHDGFGRIRTRSNIQLARSSPDPQEKDFAFEHVCSIDQFPRPPDQEATLIRWRHTSR
jgi:hypothetical protein